MSINLLAAIFNILLIFCGAAYIIYYEKAPLWERIHVFSVGFGMLVGAICLILS